jgi:hypothetical protein
VRKAIGVCAACKVDARPSHFHTAAHLNRVRNVAKAEDRQERFRLVEEAKPERVRSFDA